MNRFSSSSRPVGGGGGGGSYGNDNRSRFNYGGNSYPRYHQHNNSRGSNHHHHHHHNLSDSEDSSTHSVRVSKLIEKIKSQQQQQHHHVGGRGYEPKSEGFSYFQDRNNELIYSRVGRDSSDAGGGKRTVREFVKRERTPLHKTTVLLNNEDSDRGSSEPYSKNLYSSKYTNNNNNGGGGAPGGRGSAGGMGVGTRYFGQETDYEEDRLLSRMERVNRDRKYGTLSSSNNGGGVISPHHHAAAPVTRDTGRNSVPKIILHEEAVAEIPNGGRGGVGGGGTRSPSVNRDLTTDDEAYDRKENKGSRFLGGFLTLKRGKKHDRGTVRSNTRSPSQGRARRSGSFLNVPSGSGSVITQDHADSSSSPKYYVPYHRSTPTLYESKYERDRMSSTGGSVLSQGSYNKHVSRSMSMKAPWEPRHRVNEINYYEEPVPPRNHEASPVPVVASAGGAVENKKKTNLSRSKSMPGKKLTSLIGSWVSKSNSSKNKESKEDKKHEDSQRLITTTTTTTTTSGATGKGKASKDTGRQGDALDGGGGGVAKERNVASSKGTSKGGGGSKWGTLLRFGGKKKQDAVGGNNKSKNPSPERPLRKHDYSSRNSSLSPGRSVVGTNKGNYGDSTLRSSYAGDVGTLARGSSSYGDHSNSVRNSYAGDERNTTLARSTFERKIIPRGANNPGGGGSTGVGGSIGPGGGGGRGFY